MRTTFTVALLSGALLLIIPNATASPCDVGDTDNVCVYDYNNGFGSRDCSSEGAQYHWTSATASAGGESVTAYGYESCNHENGSGSSHQGFGVFYSGALGWYQTSYFGQGGTNGETACGLFFQDLGPTHTGTQVVFLPDDACLGWGAMPWGDLIP